MQVRILFFAVENNDKGPNVVVSYHVKIWKYKKKNPKFTLQIVQKKFLWLKKLEILYYGHT